MSGPETKGKLGFVSTALDRVLQLPFPDFRHFNFIRLQKENLFIVGN